MNVVDLGVYKDSALTPLLILIDVQKEYVTEGRTLMLTNHENVVRNCGLLLECARQRKFPTAFVCWRQNEKLFNPAQPFSGWIDSLCPKGTDMIFERSMPSCYSNADFDKMMDGGGGRNAVIAGFTGTIACLSTVIDAYHRNHKITFIHDASASHSVGSMSEATAHNAATNIVSLYAQTLTTDRWISACHQQDKTGAHANAD